MTTQRRLTLSAVSAVAAAFGVAVLAREFSRHWIDWQVFALSLAGFGTLALALVTARLVRSTDRGISETHELAVLAERDQDARIRPAVMLWHDREWFLDAVHRPQSLPFHNAGDGPALNVDVQVYWHSDNCALATTSLGPGERTRLFARTLIGGFEETWGRIGYSDLLGRRWETRFLIKTGPDGQAQFQLRAYGLRDRLPQQEYPAGWEYGADGLPRICLPEEPAA